MCIATDTRNAFHTEVEWCQSIPAFVITCGQPWCIKERYNERTKTAVDVKSDLMLLGESTEKLYIVLIAIWEVYTRAYELTKVV